MPPAGLQRLRKVILHTACGEDHVSSFSATATVFHQIPPLVSASHIQARYIHGTTSDVHGVLLEEIEILISRCAPKMSF